MPHIPTLQDRNAGETLALANYLKLGSKGVVSFANYCSNEFFKEDSLNSLHAYTLLTKLSIPVDPRVIFSP